MKKLLFISLLLSASYHYGQVGIGTPAPEPGAQLDIVASDRGLLIPRVALVDPALRNPITDIPGESLLVYNTATTAELRPGFYYWRNRWLRIQDQNDGPGGGETLTSLTDNGDGTLTYTDELGTATNITLNANETLTSLTDNGDRTLTYTDENGNSNIIDIGAMETLTLLSQDTSTGTISYTKENGLVATAQVISADADNGLSAGSDGGAFLNTDGLDDTDDAWTNNDTDSRIELGTLSDGTTVRTAENQMVVTDDGHLGVQTDTPVGPLDITDSSTPWYIHKVVSNGRHIGHYRAPDGRFASALGISIPGAGSLTGANDALVFKRGGGGSGTDFDRQGVGISISQNNEFRNMGFYTSDGNSLEERMTLDENGRLGIGTTDPQANLQVVDYALIDGITAGKGQNNDDASNTAFGFDALQGVTSGERNTGIGSSTLVNNNESGNTAIGNRAMELSTGGSGNTAVGSEALRSLESGTLNIAVGTSSLGSLQFGSHNTVMGRGAMFNLTGGSTNVVIGARSGSGITNGSGNTILGANVTGLPSTISNNVVIADGRGIQRIRVLADGNMGIGTDAPTQKLDIDGKVRIRDLSGTADLTDLVVVADATTGELKARTFGALGTDGTDDAWVNNDANNRIELATESDGTTARASGTEIVVLDNGRVGIGTNSPDASLEVNDNAIIDGLYIGRRAGGSGITAVGSNAMLANTSGNWNTAIGHRSLSSNVSNNGNTALGTGTLQNATANNNTSLGGFAMQATTTGRSNTAVGYVAMRGNNDGIFNVALGESALIANSGGDFNTVIGARAALNVTDGNYNTVLGNQTGLGLQTGNNNTILGSRVSGLPAGLNNTIILADGEGNQRIRILDNGDMGIGTEAPTQKLDINGKVRVRDLSGTADPTDLLVVADATTGELKAQTLSNLGSDGTDDAWVNNDANNRIELATESDGTTARASETEVIITDSGRMGIGLGTANPITKLQVGDWARIDGIDIGKGRNTTDISNTAIGDGALATVTGGRYNTAVGKGALRITESSGNTALGSFALFNSNSYSNTAIGGFSMQSATTGNSTVSIGYTTLRNFQTGSGNVAMGNAALIDLTSGGNNTVLGHNSGRGITNGSRNTILGSNVGGLPTNLSNNIIIADGAGNQRIRILNNGNMGVGTETPTEKLEVNGTIKATDINFTGLPTYADEAAASAGGLAQGDMYKTGTGELRIKL